jgi:acyl-CoA synthetase (AMP-forming)/AMP-acid ligase II
MAHARPLQIAVAEPISFALKPQASNLAHSYKSVTFLSLDQDSDRIAAGLLAMGILPGTRLALLVRPGIDFISIVFALFKAGIVAILIDPGMGRRNLIKFLAAAEPQGFISIPLVQAIRVLLKGQFAKAHYNVTVGRRWFWGGATLHGLRQTSWPGAQLFPAKADDPAAIIFTTGSTGPPKGVLYSHGNFDAQVDEIQERFSIQPGEIDLPGFPLFGLFNCAMGVTTVIPDMDPTRPARVNPQKIIAAARDWKVTQAFGSPAMWNRVGSHCTANKIALPTVRRVLSAGAPVPVQVLQAMTASIDSQGEMHTPYGATEALPVASISASEVLTETARRTRLGYGVCVGRRFTKIRWKVIRAVEGPIASIADVEELPPGLMEEHIGELIVSGPVVTRVYVTRPEANVLAKIADRWGTESGFWHRMGDLGYLDDQERFWFCGRLAHRVVTRQGPMYPVCCEAIFNEHPDVFRSALVGIGPAGKQRPVIILEPKAGRFPHGRAQRERLFSAARELAKVNPLTERIVDFLVHRGFPVDIRHNAKISREKLAVWAAKKLSL